MSHDPIRSTEPRAFVHDVLRRGSPLEPFFRPRAVAVVGATEAVGSVGRTVLRNLVGSPFGGTVFPVNPKRPAVLGIQAHPSVREVPAPVDLAVVVTPARAVPGVIEDCAQAGVPAAVVISAGFGETGPEGAALAQRTLGIARAAGMRLIGPNCLGVMSPVSGLNATFAAGMALPGNIALLTQSGALLTAILDWSQRERVGFSACVSVGSMIDVGWADLIDHFGDDTRTAAILVYMESVDDARAFLSAAREVSLTKPIIVIKPGRSEAAARAALSHTGALTGSDEVLDAAFRRAGVLRVDRIGDLFSMAGVLGRQPRPRGPRLTIVTNAGGPGVLATDALVDGGGALAELGPEARAALDRALPAAWSHGNPVDVLGDAGPERYAEAVRIALEDASTDGLLVVLTPQDMTDPTLTAERLRDAVAESGVVKPVLASWMGGASVQAGVEILSRADIPNFGYPDTAARTFCAMWRHSDGLAALYETPERTAAHDIDPGAGRAIVDAARADGRTLLDEHASKQLLAAYGIPTVETRIARDEAEAVAAAEALGFPVVVKLWSSTITHKTDVGGVKLDLGSAEAVASAFRDVRDGVAAKIGAEHFGGVTVQPMIARRDAYELIVGSVPDAQFGPVILFGTGGQLVEVLRDRALALPPLTTTLARRAMERTRIFRALQGVRGRAPVDLDRLAEVLVRFAQMVVDQPRVREVEINPLLAGADGIVALDARVVLHPDDTADADLPRPAIRPYPSQYVSALRARDGTELRIRPIRPDDEPLLVAFHRRLSERSVRLRYMQSFRLDERIAHERMVRICFADYDREIALVVEPCGREPCVVAVGRLSRDPRSEDAVWSLLVEDRWQARGLGAALLERLVDVARREGVRRLVGHLLAGNAVMQKLCLRLGFRIDPTEDPDVLVATLDLGPAA